MTNKVKGGKKRCQWSKRYTIFTFHPQVMIYPHFVAQRHLFLVNNPPTNDTYLIDNLFSKLYM